MRTTAITCRLQSLIIHAFRQFHSHTRTHTLNHISLHNLLCLCVRCSVFYLLCVCGSRIDRLLSKPVAFFYLYFNEFEFEWIRIEIFSFLFWQHFDQNTPKIKYMKDDGNEIGNSNERKKKPEKRLNNVSKNHRFTLVGARRWKHPFIIDRKGR